MVLRRVKRYAPSGRNGIGGGLWGSGGAAQAPVAFGNRRGGGGGGWGIKSHLRARKSAISVLDDGRE